MCMFLSEVIWRIKVQRQNFPFTLNLLFKSLSCLYCWSLFTVPFFHSSQQHTSCQSCHGTSLEISSKLLASTYISFQNNPRWNCIDHYNYVTMICCKHLGNEKHRSNFSHIDDVMPSAKNLPFMLFVVFSSFLMEKERNSSYHMHYAFMEQNIIV